MGDLNVVERKAFHTGSGPARSYKHSSHASTRDFVQSGALYEHSEDVPTSLRGRTSPFSKQIDASPGYGNEGVTVCRLGSKHHHDVDFDKLDRAVFVIDQAGRILRSNSLARRLLADGLVIRGPNDRFVPGDRDTEQRLHEGLGKLVSGCTHTFRLQRPVGDGHWLIFDLRHVRTQSCGGLEVAVKVRATYDDAPPGAWTATVRSLRLSPAEADVAFCIFSALSAKEIAKELGVSPNTVKSHLRSIYAKCGCNGYADTLRILLSLTRP